MSGLAESGAAELGALSAKLKRLARGDLKREMLRGIREAAKPLAEAAQKSAAENLPKSGGLAAEIGSLKVAVRTRSTGANPRVRLQGAKGHDTRAMDQGRLRHPVHGNRKAWVTQEINPGFWTETMKEGSPLVRRKIVAVLDDISRKL